MRPVTFHFKTHDTEKAGREISQFGLIAEEVAEVNPDLILRDRGRNLQCSVRRSERDVAQ